MRRRMMACVGSGLSALDYLGAKEAKSGETTPLLAMWDGTENNGWGSHLATLSTWKDLCGNYDLAGNVATACAANHVIFTGSQYFKNTYAGFAAQVNCIEAVFQFTANASGMILQTGKKTVGGNGCQLCWHKTIGFITNENYGSGGPCFYISYDGVSTSPISISENGNSSGIYELFKNGSAMTQTSNNNNGGDDSTVIIGAQSSGLSGYHLNANVYCVRCYSRVLTADERAANYAVDKARFGLT